MQEKYGIRTAVQLGVLRRTGTFSSPEKESLCLSICTRHGTSPTAVAYPTSLPAHNSALRLRVGGACLWLAFTKFTHPSKTPSFLMVSLPNIFTPKPSSSPSSATKNSRSKTKTKTTDQNPTFETHDSSPPSLVKRKPPSKFFRTGSSSHQARTRSGLSGTDRSSPSRPTFDPASASSPALRNSTRYDRNSHPLNLPPDELRRLSAASMSAMSDAPTPMEVDPDSILPFASVVPPSSPPQAQENAPPGAFPSQNGVNGDSTSKSPIKQPVSSQPTSQPPSSPQVDPEAAKAAGNKHFKAKDYDKAIKEYTKGR